MEESNSTTSTKDVRKKLESSSAHTKAVIDATAEAARTVGETVKKHAQGAFDVGREHLTAAAKDLGEAANYTVDDLREQANVCLNQATERVKGYQSQSEEYIRTNPLQAVGIAFAVGVLFGLIARR